MTNEEMRIAIAEECGWTHIKSYGNKPREDFICGYPPSKSERKEAQQSQCDPSIPHYTEDLNAMHEAEKTLKGDKTDEHSEISHYAEELVMVLGGHQEIVDIWFFDHIHATAQHRAEAFLRTKGKWRTE